MVFTWRDTKLQTKLLAMVLFMVLALVGLGLYSIGLTSRIAERSEQLYRENLHGVEYAMQIQVLFQALATGVNQHLNATSEDEWAAAETAINRAIQDLDRALVQYATFAHNAKERRLIKDIQSLAGQYKSNIPALVAADRAGRRQEAWEAANGLRKIQDHVTNRLKVLVDYHTSSADVQAAANRAAAASARTSGFVSMVIFAVMAAGFGLWLSRQILRPVHQVQMLAESLAAGDLTSSITYRGRDELGLMAAALNQAMQKLRQLVSQVVQAAEQVALFSEELSWSSGEVGQAFQQVSTVIDQLAQGADAQAKSAQEAKEMVEQFSQVIQQVTTTAQYMAGDSERTAASAQKGKEVLDLAIAQIGSLQETVDAAALAVRGLGDRSREIGQIVDLIADIADQTNLLALNAAIEAARAGDQGRGFAVVADEVRKLAEQSRQATEKIAVLVKEIQEETVRAIEAMSYGTRETADGVRKVNRAGESFNDILRDVEGLVNRIHELSAAAEEMAANSSRAVKAVEDIAAITEETAAGAQEVSSSSQEQVTAMQEIVSAAETLAKLAQNLKQTAGVFRLPLRSKEIVSIAKNDHQVWKMRIESLLKGLGRAEDFDENKLKDYHACRLGQWYYGSGQVEFGQVPVFQELDEVHARFHQACAEAIRRYKAGDEAGAREAAGQMEEASREIVQKLDLLQQTMEA